MKRVSCDRKLMSVVTAVVCAAGMARGAVLNWSNPLGGTASVAANWNPNQVPVATDDLFFGLNQNMTLTFNPTVSQSRSMEWTGGNTATLRIIGTIAAIPGTHTTGGVTITGNAVADTTISFVQGTLRCSTLTLGATVSSHVSTLNVNDDNAQVEVTGAGDLIVGSVDDTTLNVSNGGSVSVGGELRTGNLAAITNADVTVTGINAGSGERSSLSVAGGFDSTIAGAGDSDLAVSNGAIVTFAGPVEMASGGGTGTLTVGGVGGAGPVVPATVQMGGKLDVGTSQVAGTAGGAGTVTVNDGGAVSVAGATQLGGGPTVGGSGVLRINNGGTFATRGLNCDAGGDLQHIGGTLNITGGTFVNESPAYTLGNTPLNDPQLVLGGAAQMDATATTNGGTAFRLGSFVGGTGAAGMRLEGGSDVRVVAFSPLAGSVFATIGDDASDFGDVVVTGAGSTLSASSTGSELNVGLNGQGVLDVLAGGAVEFETINIAANAGSSGTVTVNGTGSQMRGRSRINVGGDITAGGTGSLAVGSNGVVEVTGSLVEGLVVYGDGLLTTGAGSHIDVSTILSVRAGGLMAMASGTIDATRVVLSGATLQTTGTSVIHTEFQASSGSVLTLGGATTIGSATSNFGVNTQTATMRVSGTTTLLDNSTAFLGAVEMQGGTLLAPDPTGAKMQENGTQLSGEGTIACRFSFGPGVTMAPTGTGLVFADTVVYGTAATHAGTAVRLASTGDAAFTGQTLNMKWTQDGGSVAFFGAPASSIGDNSTFGVTLNGDLLIGDGGTDVASEQLTLRDSNGVALGTLTAIAGGELICPSNLVVNAGRTLRGEGTITTPLLNVAGGVISPDNFLGPLRDSYGNVETLRVVGNYSMGATARYKCEIAFFDFDPGEFNDRINITGNATLGGTLEIIPLPTYDPASCHEFTVMTYLSKTGNFSNIIAPPGYIVVVEATRVRVLLTDIGCDSIDFNGNGVFPEDLDVIDLFEVIAGGTCSTGTCASIDFNNNCVFPEDQDVVDYFTVLAGGACSSQ